MRSGGVGGRLTAVRELWENPALRRAELAWGGFHAAEWASVVALSVVAFEANGAGAVGLVLFARAWCRARWWRRSSPSSAIGTGASGSCSSSISSGPGLPRRRGCARPRREHRRRLRARRARGRAARGAPAEPSGADTAARANAAGARRVERRGADLRVGRRAARACGRGAPPRGVRPRGGLRRVRGDLVPLVRGDRGRTPGGVRGGAGGANRRASRAPGGSPVARVEPTRSPRRRPVRPRHSSAARSACCSSSSRSTSSGWANPVSGSSPPRSGWEGSSVRPPASRSSAAVAWGARSSSRSPGGGCRSSRSPPGPSHGSRRVPRALGLANSLLDVAGFTIMQENADEQVIGRIFGLFELVVIATVGLGSLLAPVAIDVLGLTRGVDRRWRAPRRARGARDPGPRADRRRGGGPRRGARAPPADVHLAPLPYAALRRLAASLGERRADQGTAIVRQGRRGTSST